MNVCLMTLIECRRGGKGEHNKQRKEGEEDKGGKTVQLSLALT